MKHESTYQMLCYLGSLRPLPVDRVVRLHENQEATQAAVDILWQCYDAAEDAGKGILMSAKLYLEDSQDWTKPLFEPDFKVMQIR